MEQTGRGLRIATVVLLGLCAVLLGALLAQSFVATRDQLAEASRFHESLTQNMQTLNQNVASLEAVHKAQASRAEAVRSLVNKYLQDAEETYRKAVFQNAQVKGAMHQIIIQGQFTFEHMLLLLKALAELG